MGKYLFYDIEVYNDYACIVFIDENNKEYLYEYPFSLGQIRRLIANKTLVAYNNHFYDDYMLNQILRGLPIKVLKKINDEVISGDVDTRTQLITLDVMKQIDVSQPSLKKIQANLGRNIHETPVDFNVKTTTPEQRKLIVEYCKNDTRFMKEVFYMRNEYFTLKQKLIDDFNLSQGLIKYNNTTIVSKIFTAPIRKKHDISIRNDVVTPDEVLEFWRSHEQYEKDGKYTGKVITEQYGCVIEWGWGGLHAVNKSQIKWENVKLADIEQMYPNTMIMRKSLGANTRKYQELLAQRKQAKRDGNTLKSNALKLIANSTYGLLGNQYSSLYNKLEALSVCIWGQQVIHELAMRLYNAGAIIVQVNTDGVAYQETGKDLQYVLDQWEKDYEYKLEVDWADVMFQRDINNYIMVNGDKIKVKGGDVGRYHSTNPYGNCSRRIVDQAIVDYLVKSISVEQTVKSCDNILDFQMIIKCTSGYEAVTSTGEVLQNVNRVYAVNSGWEIFQRHKELGNTRAFPNTSKRLIVTNDDPNINWSWLDYDWYIDHINNKLSKWLD